MLAEIAIEDYLKLELLGSKQNEFGINISLFSLFGFCPGFAHHTCCCLLPQFVMIIPLLLLITVRVFVVVCASSDFIRNGH